MAQKRDKEGNKVLSRKKKENIKALRPVKDSHKGKIPIRKDLRRKLISDTIRPRTYYCPALEAYVVVTNENVKHYKNQSVKTYQSMKALMNIRKVIKNGVLMDVDRPKANSLQSRYSKMQMLYCRISCVTGTETVKLVIGTHKTIQGKREVYSITAVDVK